MKYTVTTRWWVIGILVLTGIGVIGVFTYKALHPFTPVEFLSGATPVRMKSEKSPRPRWTREVNGVLYNYFQETYALPIDFDTLNAKAQQELVRKGFQPPRRDSAGVARYSITDDAS